MYQRPIGKKAQTRVVLAILVLAWATQLLVAQWGYGAERFVAGRSGVLELRAEARVHGNDVRLKQVCRWAERDEALFAALGEIVVARVTPEAPFKAVTLADLRVVLGEAGVDLAAVRFAGPVKCMINRVDALSDPSVALTQWQEAIAARADGAAAPAPLATASPASQPGLVTLRDVLTRHLAEQLQLPLESLQITFDARDEKLLALPEGLVRFHVEPRRARNLGPVNWDVIVIRGDESQRVNVAATARAWQDQVVAVRPIAYKQIIQPSDVAERRALIDRLDDAPVLARQQAVGQQAALELRPGAVLNARTVQATPLAQSGQLVTVTVMHGTVQVKTVARAMETGTFGQNIRVRNETTKEVFEVTLTGPQQGTLGGGAAAAAGNVTVGLAG